MIGSLRGTVLEADAAGELLVEVGGVGYRVIVPAAVLAAHGQCGAEVLLWIHHHVREDAQALYGFATSDERKAFTAILGAHGVGPALALAILTVHPPTSLHQVLLDDDVDALCLVPGVGKKTAAKLLIELKSRLDLPELGRAPVSTAVGPGQRDARADVREALASLGYGNDEVAAVVRDLPDEGDTGDLLRVALQLLGAPA